MSSKWSKNESQEQRREQKKQKIEEIVTLDGLRRRQGCSWITSGLSWTPLGRLWGWSGAFVMIF